MLVLNQIEDDQRGKFIKLTLIKIEHSNKY